MIDEREHGVRDPRMRMTKCQVIVEGDDAQHEHEFDGKPPINLDFTLKNGKAYRVTTRSPDEDLERPTNHAVLI
jgi:hypothetical protein